MLTSKWNTRYHVGTNPFADLEIPGDTRWDLLQAIRPEPGDPADLPADERIDSVGSSTWSWIRWRMRSLLMRRVFTSQFGTGRYFISNISRRMTVPRRVRGVVSDRILPDGLHVRDPLLDVEV
jgi:hypothetical protein